MPPSDPDPIMDRLIRWSDQDDWARRRTGIIADHLEPISETFDLYNHEIIDLVGGGAILLLTFIIEEFLATGFDDLDGRSAVGSYLDQHDWREDIQGKRYLQAFDASTAELYEICDLGPGSAITIRSLLPGGDPVTVADPGPLDPAARGDCFAGRLLDVGGEPCLTPGILHYPRDMAHAACAILGSVADAYLELIRRKSAQSVGEDDDLALQGARSYARVVSRTLTGFWMTSTLGVISRRMPRLRNSDDEKIHFCDIGFPIRADAAEVAAILDQIDAFERDPGDGLSWTWQKPDPAEEVEEDAYPESMALSRESFLGIVGLTSDMLILGVNSEERAKRGRDLLAVRLGRRVGKPRSRRRRPDLALKESKD